MIHFMLSPSSIMGLACKVKQDAWMSVLIASAIGILNIIFIYGTIYKYNHKLTFIKILEKYFGIIFGKIIAIIYIIYFMFISLLILRHIYEVLIMYLLPGTPKIIIISICVLLIIYSVNKGIESIARAGEIYFFATMFAYISFIFFLLFSNIINFNNLFPILDNGFKPVVKASIPLFIAFPFGELVPFLTIFHYLNKSKGTVKTSVLAMLSITFILTILTILTIITLGAYIINNSPYPTIKMIRLINVGFSVRRLYSLAVMISLTSSVIKLMLFFFVTTTGLRDIFDPKSCQKYIIPTSFITVISTYFIFSYYTSYVD